MNSHHLPESRHNIRDNSHSILVISNGICESAEQSLFDVFTDFFIQEDCFTDNQEFWLKKNVADSGFADQFQIFGIAFIGLAFFKFWGSEQKVHWN